MTYSIPEKIINDILVGLIKYGDRSILHLTYENGLIIKAEPEREFAANSRNTNTVDADKLVAELSVLFKTMADQKSYGYLSIEFGNNGMIRTIVDKRVYKGAGLNDDKMLLGAVIQKLFVKLEKLCP